MFKLLFKYCIFYFFKIYFNYYYIIINKTYIKIKIILNVLNKKFEKQIYQYKLKDILQIKF